MRRGAFIMTIKDREKFQEAIRTKACSRSCRPHAGAPDRPGGRERAPGALSDRRKKMAGAQGAVSVETIIQSHPDRTFCNPRKARARPHKAGAPRRLIRDTRF